VRQLIIVASEPARAALNAALADLSDAGNVTAVDVRPGEELGCEIELEPV
jgi:hypothetical protein